ncbi:hypothetical protein BCR41DRAFT_312974 [Lobosporangium transversale]|uniref:Golgi SNAP receptor complex member 1 n=1 Tax=Lobosporangium transversale TaxID=64571 RepID=A0A1Y2GBJ5_9FUNG|nr:hypothetical protein BCR41DRAFT_312974 [Lobosporangium transversale]ORZ04549.1 hypothetical protein BCR41DRAFT_312974 [Lobosporangium transversale]|eukprot:XP_021876595.1 hypothetical protein BCR41DRAFT_312974 [Lobosporangium transversale]
MQKTTPSRTPIYKDAPLNSHSPSVSPALSNASLAIAQATGTAIPTWDTLRKDARHVEIEIESKLTTLSKSVVKINQVGRQQIAPVPSESGQDSGAGVTATPEELEKSIEDLLAKLNRLVDAMSGHIETHTQTNGQAPLTMVHTLQKHRDSLHDYTKEYKKTCQNVRAARDHAQLLSSVQEDISVFKNGASGSMSATDYLLNERSRIDGSHRLADSALEQAYATHDDLRRQGSALQNVNQRINNVASQLPGVGQLIGKIQSRKNRDNVILSCVIGSCVVFVLYTIM